MRNKAIWAAGSFIVALLAVSLFAQAPQVRAQIDFAFSVENKVMPAGTYDFIRDESASVFRVTEGGKSEAVVQVQTRLASLMPGMPDKPEVVFDKIGDKYVLAEIWIPGEDGYAITMTKAKHEHKVVIGK